MENTLDTFELEELSPLDIFDPILWTGIESWLENWEGGRR
jgi:hypothetical protein